jgi:predicted phosphohydrolase
MHLDYTDLNSIVSDCTRSLDRCSTSERLSTKLLCCSSHNLRASLFNTAKSKHQKYILATRYPPDNKNSDPTPKTSIESTLDRFFLKCVWVHGRGDDVEAKRHHEIDTMRNAMTASSAEQ